MDLAHVRNKAALFLVLVAQRTLAFRSKLCFKFRSVVHHRVVSVKLRPEVEIKVFFWGYIA